MANTTFTKVELYGQNNDGDPRRYTVASGTAISKGTLLAMTDARTAIAQSTAGQALAGVASMDKSATDLSTSISAWTNGIFEARASGAHAAGVGWQSAVGGNNVSSATGASGAFVGGWFMEESTDNELVNVRLRL